MLDSDMYFRNIIQTVDKQESITSRLPLNLTMPVKTQVDWLFSKEK
jgi:hypothetical protein